MDTPTTYMVRDASGERGPYTLGQLRAMWSAGSITADAKLRPVGDASEWKPMFEMVESSQPGPAASGGCGRIFGAAIFWAIAAVVYGSARSVFHEILAALLVLIGVVIMATGRTQPSTSPVASASPQPVVAGGGKHVGGPLMLLGLIVIIIAGAAAVVWLVVYI